MYFNIFKNRQRVAVSNIMPHIIQNTKKREKCFVLYLNKSAIYCLYPSNVTLSVKYQSNNNIPLFVNRLDAYR